MSHRPQIVALFALIGVITLAFGMANRARTARAEAPLPGQTQPVEEDMHEFMEYAFEPSYKRLKPALAAAPDNSGWKGIKGDALILAEGGNLLLLRKPKEDAAAWNELSAAVRDAGGSLYRAAKAKDYPTARRHYEAMLNRCNACHNKFAGGEHQLAP